MERSREFTVVVQQDEQGHYVAEAPELQGCYTQATSLDELMDRIKEAIQVCLEEDEPAPALRFVGVQRVLVRVACRLPRAKGPSALLCARDSRWSANVAAMHG